LAPDAIAWCEWDDELVFNNDSTGSTHHLGALGAEVLLALLRSPRGIDTVSLTSDIGGRVVLDAKVELLPEIERTLLELAGLRLAESTAGR
jgi:hypothetical protein